MKKTTLFMAALLAGTFAMSAAELAKGVINNAIPEGWTYITNNEDYPNPSFYDKSGGGLKMNFEGMGLLSPQFTAEGDVEVIISIAALNQNQKTGAEGDAFTITGLNANGEEVATAGLASVEAGDNTATLQGTGITQVKIIMTAYPYDGEKYCNVNLGSVTINGEAGSGIAGVAADETAFYVSNGVLMLDGVANGTQVEIYNALGARMMTTVFDGAGIPVSDLNSGMYIVRAGKDAKKVMF